MASNTVALDQCLEKVTESAPMALERCLDHVVAALQRAEGNSVRSAERAELAEAWRELLQHKATWCRLYPDELKAAFRFAIQPGSNAADHASRPGDDDQTSLSLVDDAEVTQTIESSRLVQHVMPMVEDPVSELDALVSSAMGLETVHAERNPVRPEVFAHALRELSRKTATKAATGSLWLKYLADPLGEELQHLYDGLVVQLKRADVQAAGYGRAPGSGTAGSSQQPPHDNPVETEAPAAKRAGQDSSAWGNWSSQRISHALLRDFVRHADSAQTSQAPPQAYYAGVRQELDDLQRQANSSGEGVAIPRGYRELPAVDRPALPIGVHSSLSAEVWGDYGNSHERSMVRSRLRQDVTQISQVLGLELVREVVNQVARDPRLLTPIREAIVALEPSLLRLAMVDPRFFSEEQHPGRLLMERAAQRSFKYNDEFSSEFSSFFDDVRQEFNALNQSKIADTTPFEAALDRLQVLWERQDSEDEARHRQAVEAVRFAELRHAQAAQIAAHLSQRPDMTGVPQVVQDFLFGPWSLVLAHARLTGDGRQPDPGGYLAVISTLLWSVKREVTLRMPAQLFERIPPLLGKLREGLACLGQEPAEHEAFFQALMKLHHPVLKLRRAKSRRDARESGQVPSRIFEAAAPAPPQPQQPAAQPGQPWMSPRERDAAGFEDTLPTGAAPLLDESGSCGEKLVAAGPAPVTGAADAVTTAATRNDAQTVLARLREGDWIDLYSRRSWHRAQLVWAGSRGTLFMFVSHGGRPHSMTRRICERLISNNYLRPVHAHDVVARALDALDQDDVPAP